MGGPGSGRRKGSGRGIFGKKTYDPDTGRTTKFKKMSKGERKRKAQMLGASRPPKKIRKAMKSLAKYGVWS